ncbi:peptidoglycan-binding protein [uncultured Streptomyces sp.]|uniref:peptidoglycan-binding domain-containing protein n=1 Tax=uncultured Streptomyces sp. TaxID=174707 RepID=UPI00263703E9|nr:peptidoglycan-binding protein [uncultured Streptomyces sp.]
MRKNLRNPLLQGLAAALLAGAALGAVSTTGDQASASTNASTREGAHAATNAARLPAWPVLKTGSRGTDVLTLQHLLAARGHAVKADGAFGKKTAAAVRSFQQRAGLKTDGAVGPNTWSKLTAPTLRTGAKGSAVKAAQVQLGVKTDGVFGENTRSAVRSFQTGARLKADGIVGPKTWNALINRAAPAKPATGKPAGTSVALARQLLNTRGITYARTHSETVDSRSTAYRNIHDMAKGIGAATSGNSHVGYKRVQLDPRMLHALITLHDKYGYTLQISEFVGGVHSKGSHHYRGLSFDANFINGIHVGSGAPHKKVMTLCTALGATQVLGPGDPGHSTHIHCAWR